MPNRRAVTRGGAMELAILESIRAGHSVRAACAAAGVPVRTYYNFAQRSAAHRHDREVAEQESERRLVGTVLNAADGGDVKAAQWLLERRWPQVYGSPLRIDARVQGDYHHDVDVEVLALAERYSGLTGDEVAAEAKRLAWVDTPADDTGQERIAHGATAVPLLPAGVGGTEGDGAAHPDNNEASHGAQPPDTGAPTVEGVDEAEAWANGRHGPPQPAEPLQPFEWHPGPEPIRCIHCRGTHEAACPHAVEGTFRIDPSDLQGLLGGGDPR